MRFVRWQKGLESGWATLLTNGLIQPLDRAPYLGGRASGGQLKLAEVKLLAPCEPGKIVAVGHNYRAHIREMNHPMPQTPIIFLKPPTALLDPQEAIVLPPLEISERVDYEGELALVIASRTSNVTAKEAEGKILGFTLLNDVTARDVQARDGQWTRAKGFDTFAPTGPLLTDEIDPQDILLETRVNGALRQTTSTSDQIWTVYELISFISRSMTLMPGDLVTTGTPSGIGQLHAGDTVEISGTGIGVLKNLVRAD